VGGCSDDVYWLVVDCVEVEYSAAMMRLQCGMVSLLQGLTGETCSGTYRWIGTCIRKEKHEVVFKRRADRGRKLCWVVVYKLK
jgi:hypothetical protein